MVAPLERWIGMGCDASGQRPSPLRPVTLRVMLVRLRCGQPYGKAENHTTVNATPLDKTLVNVGAYINDAGTDTVFCDEIVKDILRIYGATLFSWEGYWYIVRQEEWLNERRQMTTRFVV